MDIVVQNGKYIIKTLPLEACIGNMVRRVLQIIREEYISELKSKTDETYPQESLHKILTAEDNQQIDFNVSIPFLKTSLIEHINEFETELETWWVIIIFVSFDLFFSAELLVFYLSFLSNIERKKNEESYMAYKIQLKKNKSKNNAISMM